MTAPSPTALLLAWGRGDRAAFDKLVPLVHDELHRIAGRYMGDERPGGSLQTTALINEAYIRLIDISRIKWRNRAHFFAMAARVIRRILVDAARARNWRERRPNTSTREEAMSTKTSSGVASIRRPGRTDDIRHPVRAVDSVSSVCHA